MLRLSLFVATLAVLWLSRGTEAQALIRQYANCQIINYPFDIRVYWTVKGDGTIDMAMEANTRGYLSLAISADGTMKPRGTFADGWVASASTATTDTCYMNNAIGGCLFDQYMTSTSLPRYDTNDLTNRRVKVNRTGAGHLSAEWNRKIDTGRPTEDKVIDLAAPMSMMWALHPTSTMAGNKAQPDVPGHMCTAPKICYGPATIFFGGNSSCSQSANTNSFASPAGDFKLDWVKSTDGLSITFTVTAKTSGYASFGLSTTPAMAGADVYVGWVSGGVLTVLDQFSPDYTQPVSDTARGGQNNIGTPTGSLTAGVLTYSFTRLLQTNDPSDQVITNSNLYVMYAMAASPGSGATYVKHTTVGSGIVNFISGTSSGGVPSPTYNGTSDPLNGTTVASQFSSADGVLTVAWAVDEPSGTIAFTLTLAGSGWMSVGWSASGVDRMANSDCVVAWIDASGVAHAIDTWSPDQLQPRLDSSRGGTDDLTSVTGSATGGTATVSFTRPLASTDSANDVPITNTNMHVLYAYHPTSVPDAAGTYASHSPRQRGAQIVNFFTGQSSVAPEDPLDPGQALSIIVVVACAFFILLRAARRIKRRYFRDRTWLCQRIEGAGKPEFQRRDIISAPTLVGANTAGSLNANEAGTSKSLAVAIPLSQMRQRNASLSPDEKLAPEAFSSSSSPTSAGSAGRAPLRPPRPARPPRPLMTVHSSQHNFPAGSGPRVPPPPPPGKKGAHRHTPSSSRANMFMGGEAKEMQLSDDDFKPTVSVVPEAGAGGEAKSDGSHYVKAAPARIDESAKADFEDAKVNRSGCSNTLWGLLDLRIPYTQISVGLILLFGAFIAANAICVLYVGTRELSYNFGYLSAANSVFVAIIATRNSAITWLLGFPFDSLVMVHRWMGRWLLLCMTLHMGYFWAAWNDPTAGNLIVENTFNNTGHLYGWLAWFFAVIMFLTSLEPIRRRWYEVFSYSHFGFILFYVFMWYHVEKAVPYVLAVVISYGGDRLLRFIWSVIPFTATLVRLKMGKVVQIRFPKHPIAKAFGLYKTGQYVFLNFPQLSLFQWHPFSISSGPDEVTGEVHIKGLGGHTMELVERCGKPEGKLWVRVDGPYGHVRIDYRRYPILCLAAGGVGITPIIGILKDLYRVGDLSAEDKLVIKPHYITDVYMLWAMPTYEAFTWFKEEVDQCLAAAGTGPFPRLHVTVCMTREKQMPAGAAPLNDAARGTDLTFKLTRPDVPALFATMLAPKPGDGAAEEANRAVTTFVCGPEALVNELWDTAAENTRNGVRVDFHHETFEF